MSVTRGLLTSGSPFPCGITSAAGIVPLNFPFIGFYRRRRTAGHPQCLARRHPVFRSSPGGLRRRASVGRQSVSCFHTQPVGDTHGSLFTPTFPTLRAAVPVLRPVPRLPPAYFYNAIFPFITKIVRPGRFTFLQFPSTRRTAGHPRRPAPCVSFQSGRPPAQGERGPAECVMLPHTVCRGHPRFALHPDFPSTPGCHACAAASPATSASASYNQTFYRNYPPFIEKSFSVRNRHFR